MSIAMAGGIVAGGAGGGAGTGLAITGENGGLVLDGLTTLRVITALE